MDPTKPASALSTFALTEATSPTQTPEEEAAATLVKLMEHHSRLRAGSFHVEVTPPDMEKVALENTVSKAQEDSADEYLDESDKERLEEGADELLELEDDPPEVRRCNRSSGQGWFCHELAHPGYAVCLKHIKVRRRREYLQKKGSKKLRASTRSEASVGPSGEDRETSAAGHHEEMAGLSSPESLA